MLFASLAGLIAFIYAGGEWYGLAGGFGFPTDAAWVRAVFARSVVGGHGLTFNPGTPVAGVAAPSWILALGMVAGPRGEYIIGAKMLGVLCLILSAFLAWALTLRLLRDWRFAFLAGLLIITSPLLSAQALSGTEGLFAGMLILAAIYWQGLGWEGTRWQRVVAAFTLGLAALARPELILLLPLALLDRWLISGLHSRPGDRAYYALARSFPEVLGAALLCVPYVLYNLRAGGPLWQQPDLSLRLQPVFAWSGRTLAMLWHANPALLVAALAGLLVILLAPARERSEAPSFLPAVAPVVLLFLPGLLWRGADPKNNAVYSAAYLLPLLAILAAGGLFLGYRVISRLAPPARGLRKFRLLLGLGSVLVFGLMLVLAVTQHRVAWNQHMEDVKQTFSLQVCAGKWAAQHLSGDASIASREVGGIGFFSNRRVVDLGGSISMEGIRALLRTSSPDADLLAYLQRVQPSHIALRPAEFPNVTARPDLLTPLVTCAYTNPAIGGMTRLVLYETIWPAPSMRAAELQRRERRP